MNTNIRQLSERRLPVTIGGWENHPALTLSQPKLAVPRVYPAATFTALATESLTIVRTALGHRRADFHIAAREIAPEGWRLLLLRGHFTVEALSLFAFSPSVELRRLCTANDEFEDPPEEFLGSSRSPAEIGSATEMALRQMDESHACASWMVLAVAQSVPLNRAEQLNCPWWEPDWLANLTQRLRFA